MKWRIRKKLEKRRGYRHYKQFKEWSSIIRFGVKKYGQAFIDWYNLNNSENCYHRKMMILKQYPSGTIRDMILYTNVFPSSILPSNSDHRPNL